MMIGSLKTVPPRIFRICEGRSGVSENSGQEIFFLWTYSTVGTPPHLLEVEFLVNLDVSIARRVINDQRKLTRYPGLIWSDRSTLDTNVVFLDRFR